MKDEHFIILAGIGVGLYIYFSNQKKSIIIIPPISETPEIMPPTSETPEIMPPTSEPEQVIQPIDPSIIEKNMKAAEFTKKWGYNAIKSWLIISGISTGIVIFNHYKGKYNTQANYKLLRGNWQNAETNTGLGDIYNGN